MINTESHMNSGKFKIKFPRVFQSLNKLLSLRSGNFVQTSENPREIYPK